jgi:hypothetical protein
MRMDSLWLDRAALRNGCGDQRLRRFGSFILYVGFRSVTGDCRADVAA